jgi:hypothetical protein
MLAEEGAFQGNTFYLYKFGTPTGKLQEAGQLVVVGHTRSGKCSIHVLPAKPTNEISVVEVKS